MLERIASHVGLSRGNYQAEESTVLSDIHTGTLKD